MTHCLEILMTLKRSMTYEISQIVATYQGISGVVKDKCDGQIYRVVITPCEAPKPQPVDNGMCECGRGPMMDEMDMCQRCYEETEKGLKLRKEAYDGLEADTRVTI